MDEPFEFEKFAVELYHPGFVANKIQRKDDGMDGYGRLLYPVIETARRKI